MLLFYRWTLLFVGVWLGFESISFWQRGDEAIDGSTHIRGSLGVHNMACPDPEHIQSRYVKESYEESRHAGFYYELAFKDVTQPRLCKCNTSNKTLTSPSTLHDDFSIECAGQLYHSDLSFEWNSSKRGVMIGYWNNFSLIKGVTFPNTIVDVGWNDGEDYIMAHFQYDWVIEFQCKDREVLVRKIIEYYGINFYSKSFDARDVLVDKMLRVATEIGLASFLHSGLELHLVDHTHCLENH